VLVDLDPAEAQRRRARVRAADRFESEAAAFFERVRMQPTWRARAPIPGASSWSTAPPRRRP
jgi:hypothetical protein